jgi:hypothetical protein
MLVALIVIVLVGALALAGHRYGLPALQSRRPVPKVRLGASDRAHLEQVWKHVQGAFVDHPEVAVKLAQTTAADFLQAHAIDASGMPEAPNRDHEPASTEDLRQEMIAIKVWVDDRVGGR